ncbi:armadillo-type protein [Chlamydoabsidia padenii]|nr:armadillo-type protein [Chlamydoabsidia padenii]
MSENETLAVLSAHGGEALVGTEVMKTSSLVERLQELHKELQTFEQQRVDLPSLAFISKQLVHEQILQHDSSLISTLACCCIVDIIRLHAPEAPYNNAQLMDIFYAFTTELGKLGENNTQESSHRKYLLERLAKVKIFVIMVDLEQAQDMAIQLLQQFFETAKNIPKSTSLYCNILDIRISLIENMDLSKDALELVLGCLAGGKNVVATQQGMAMDLYTSTSLTLQKAVFQRFAKIMETAAQPGQNDIDDLKRWLQLIHSIYFVEPSLLLNVIPQIQQALEEDKLDVRQLAMETIGTMLSNQSPALLRDYPGVWRSWLERSKDKSTVIRESWVELGCLIYQHHPDTVADEINDHLVAFFEDPSVNVRSTTCRCMGKFDTDILATYISNQVLTSLSIRCIDSKTIVQDAAMNALGTIYAKLYYKLDSLSIWNKFGWIPCKLFNGNHTKNLALEATLDDTILKYIIPTNLDDDERAIRLINVFMSFDEKATDSFSYYIDHGKRLVALLLRFIGSCNDKETDPLLATNNEQNETDQLIKRIARRFDKSDLVSNCLKQIRHMADQGATDYLRHSVDEGSHHTDIWEAQNSLLKLFEQQAPELLDPCKWILDRTHLLVLDKSIVPHLYEMLGTLMDNPQPMSSEKNSACQDLCKIIAVKFPRMCIPYTNQLIGHIMNKTTDLKVDISLEILASTMKHCHTDLALDSESQDMLLSFATSGCLTQAKHATEILCTATNLNLVCAELSEVLLENMDLNNTMIQQTLESLSVVSLYYPLLLENHLKHITSFIETNYLKHKLVSLDPRNNCEWKDFADLEDITKQKLVALPILSNYLLGMSNINQVVVPEYVAHVFSILWNLVESKCDTAVENGTNAAETSQLRILAGCTIIELAETPAYQTALDVIQFEHLALLLQDSCYFVRLHFAEFIMQGLVKAKISPQYQILLFLCAFEPEDALLQKVGKFIHTRANQSKSDILGPLFGIDRFIHLLAHHPDFETSDDELWLFSRYFEFYLDCVATSKNTKMLYYHLQRIKISLDCYDEEKTLNSHILSELAMILLEHKANNYNWQLAPSTSSKLDFHSKLYKVLPDGAIQKRAIEMTYLSKELKLKLAKTFSRKQKKTVAPVETQTSNKRHKKTR